MVLTIFGVFSLQVNKDEKVTQAQVEHKSSEIKIRAANMVRASEALSHLVTDIQEFLILNDFSSINATVSQQTGELEGLIQEREDDITRLYQSLQTADPTDPMDSH
jgi:mediator of RNA polymerase II transcription subunit 22